MIIGLLLPLPPPHTILRRPQIRNTPHRNSAQISCSNSSSSSSWEREESRWLREEQRWLREEQRWLREESRWKSERESLLRELQNGRREADEVKVRSPDVVALEEEEEEEEEEVEDVKEIVVVEEDRVEEEVEEEETRKIERRRRRRMLRGGAEGRDVQEMQEALEKLGFYSGEEDIEFSTFSSGTERAVKTWQASIGVHEDGIMSTELLEKLFTGSAGEDGNPKAKPDQEKVKLTATEKHLLQGNTNGTLLSSTPEIKQAVMKDYGSMEADITKHGVFLLGENRWEDQSRLVNVDNPSSLSNSTSSMKCDTCRGEGRLMCTECDGSGEPNIEPQFIEWIGEDTKCAYCEGLGYITCDVCEGKAVLGK